MFRNKITIWKKAPFVRFLPPLIAGIILQWYVQLSMLFAWVLFALSIVLILFSFFLSHFRRFQFSALYGIGATLLFLSLGSLIIWYKDIRHNPEWVGHHYRPNDILLVMLHEPVVEKANSFRAFAGVRAI